MRIGEFDGDQAMRWVRNGGVVEAAFARLAEGHDSVGVATVSGAGSQWLLGEDVAVGMQGNGRLTVADGGTVRSAGLYAETEEHTSELQSLMRISYAVFCLKKKHKNIHNANSTN